MNLFPHKKTQRKRKLLQPSEMNLAKANGDHARNERRKGAINNTQIAMIIGGAVSIPLLYLGWCIALLIMNPQELPDTIKLGLTALFGFLFGKANLFSSNKDSEGGSNV